MNKKKVYSLAARHFIRYSRYTRETVDQKISNTPKISGTEYHIRLIPSIKPHSNNSHRLAMRNLAGVHTHSPDVKVQLIYIWSFTCHIRWRHFYILLINDVWHVSVQEYQHKETALISKYFIHKRLKCWYRIFFLITKGIWLYSSSSKSYFCLKRIIRMYFEKLKFIFEKHLSVKPNELIFDEGCWSVFL